MSPAEKQAAARREVLDDLAAVLGTDRGRRALWWLLGETGMYQTSLGPDAQATAFNEGRRSVGLMLAHTLAEANPDLFVKLQTDGYLALRERRAELDRTA